MMEDAAPAVATVAGTAVVNMAFACLLAVAVAGRWLAARGTPWAAAAALRVARLALPASLTGLASAAVLVWLEATSLADGGAASARSALASLLAGTHYGHAAVLGLASLAVVLGAAVASGGRAAGGAAWAVSVTGLACFAASRAAMGHAASGPQGDWSLAVAMDVVHQLSGLLWTGEVALAGWVVLGPMAAGQAEAAWAGERAAWAAALSRRAAWALAAVVATGAYATWRSTGSLAAPFAPGGDAYGRTLQWKLGGVAVAVLLGGFNRFVLLPRLPQGRGPGQGTGSERALRWFAWVLRAEALVLAVVVVLAAVLANAAPPAMA